MSETAPHRQGKQIAAQIISSSPIPVLAPEVLLKETYNYIVEHPEEHNQRRWQSEIYSANYCGTAYCFAGMAVHLAGFDMDFFTDEVVGEAWDNSPHISDVARKLLDLDECQAEQLFNAKNCIENIRDLLEQWNVL